MTYDFETVLDRRGTNSVAADVIPFPDCLPDEGFDPIPMWIADMAYPVAPKRQKQLRVWRRQNGGWHYSKREVQEFGS